MNRRGFFSRLLGLGVGAAVAKALPAAPSDAAHPLYVIDAKSGFAIVTPEGKRIELGAAPSRDVYGVGPGEEALRDARALPYTADDIRRFRAEIRRRAHAASSTTPAKHSTNER